MGLITNIGPTHLETLGSLDGVASAKAELLVSLSPSEGVAILNRDDPFYAYLRSRAPGRVVTFGLGPDADVSAEEIQETDTLTQPKFVLVYESLLTPFSNRKIFCYY